MSRLILPVRLLSLALLLAAAAVAARAGAEDFDFSGHLKGRYQSSYFPDDSFFRELAPATLHDLSADLRLNFGWRTGAVDWRAAYTLLAANSDTQEYLAQGAGLLPGLTAGAINDDRRWWDLTHVIDDDPSSTIVQRLDRLSVGYTGANASLRFGRQAVSWGNGLIFTPMDIFNPFDPLAVDTEYKPGDDMLYGQWLFDNGNDLQSVAVVRRDPVTGDVTGDQSSLAFKYHGFLGSREFDLLLAEHYDDTVLGLGGLSDIGDAILRGDLTVTQTDHDTTTSAVVNLSYSWVWGGKNVSGTVEYYHNGFGQSDQRYAPVDLLGNDELIRRIERGELFTLGRNYLAGSLLVEVTPLLNFSPNLFINTGDPSGLLQVIGRYDWQQNLQVLGSINLPFGGHGSEYGGIPSGVDGQSFELGPNLYLQLDYYF